jgi:hypothetical protein
MNKTKFLEAIKYFNNISHQGADNQEIIQKYPYFMLARLIQAGKGITNDISTVAAMFPNREHLYNVLKNSSIFYSTPESAKCMNENQGEDIFSLNDDLVVDLHSCTTLDELVDKFNTKHPKIAYIHPEDINSFEEDKTYKDLCKNSLAERMNIVSETLANIYKDQGNYDKAIKIYEVLTSKYPEKSSIFANSIETLKQLKITKSKTDK